MKFTAVCFALFCLWPAHAQSEFLSDIEFSPNGQGGLSGLEISDDGTAFNVLTDRGKLISGTLLRDGDRISGYTVQTATVIRDTSGRPVTGRNSDSEGIALRPDGRLFVLAIVSTSKGIMTAREARRQGVGGEVLCYIW